MHIRSLLVPSHRVLAPLALLFTAKVASAAESSAPSPPSSSAEHLRGLEMVLRPSLGSVGSSSPVQVVGASADAPQPFRAGSSLYGASIGAGFQLGFRFHPIVSAGLRGDLGSVSADGPTDGTQNLSRSWQSGGLYARVYPLALNESVRRYVDPWIASGLMYVHDGQAFSTPTTTNGGGKLNVAWQVDSHAIGVPIGVGVDYRVTQWLSAGPAFEYVIMNPIAGCAKGSAPGIPEQRVCTDDPKSKQGLVAAVDGAWNVGLSLRVTPF